MNASLFRVSGAIFLLFCCRMECRAQEMVPLTPERIAEIRKLARLEEETSNSDQSICVAGDCIPYPDKTVLLNFTEDVRSVLERTLRAPAAKTVPDSQAVTFHGPQFKIRLYGRLSSPDAATNGSPSHIATKLTPYRIGHENLATLTLTITNPGERLSPHELSYRLVDGLVRLKVLSYATPAKRSSPPASWFTLGLTRSFDPQGRQPDYDAVRTLYFAGRLPPLASLVGENPAVTLANPELTTELAIFWLSFPDVPARFRTLCTRLGQGEPWSADLFLETSIGSTDRQKADRLFDLRMARRAADVLSLGVTTPEYAKRTAIALQLFPGKYGVPADFADTPQPLELLLEPETAKWAPQTARLLRAEALRAAAGRGDKFREAAEAIAEVLHGISIGKPPKNAARILQLAREQMLNSATE
ncbi:MAG: hypothetical protein ACI4QT_03250 [Kiritimatiellia bacterium]